MQTRSRLCAFSLAVLGAAVLMLLPRAERRVPNVATDAPLFAGPATADELQSPPASARGERSSASSSGATEAGPVLSLTSLPLGVRLSEPRLVVSDPAAGAEQILLDASELRLASGVARTVELRSGSPGWVVTPDHVVLASDSHDRFIIQALPRQVIELQLTASAPLPSARLSVSYEYKNGCCPERRSLPPLQIELQGGAALLEAPPLDVGRFRLEVSSPEHYLVQSPWLELDPRGWSRVALTLAAYEGGTAQMFVDVLDASGGPVAGAQATLFEDVAEAPLIGLRVEGDGLHAQRDGEYDPELLDFPVRAETDADGATHLAVRAPGTYRLAVWKAGSVEFLGPPVEFVPNEEQRVEVRLEPGATLAGHVRFLRDDPVLASVRRLGGVRLRRGSTSYSCAFDAQGAFAFRSLPAGAYLLTVDGIVDRDGSSESAVPLLAREFELLPGEAREVELPIGSLAPGRILAGSLSSGDGEDGWHWMVALFPRSAPAESMPVQVTRGDATGGFILAGVPDGEWIVAAMGRCEDGRGLAFARRELTVSAEMPTRIELELSSQGRPLELASTAPAGEAREVQLEVGAADPLTRRMLEELPPLSVSAESGARYLGLPEVPLAVRVGTASIPVERGSVVWLP